MGKKSVACAEKLREVIPKNYSIASVCRELGLRPCGGNYKTIKKIIKDNNLDISHFTGQAWNRGLTGFKSPRRIPLNGILDGSIFYSNSNTLRLRLLKEGIKDHKCEICNLTEWLGNPIPLELDHINGNNTDNRLVNLRVVCPNCHAQTPTYRAKNKLSALSEKRDVDYRKFGEPLTGNPEPSISNNEGVETRHGRPKPVVQCKTCNAETSNKTCCSLECYKKYQNRTVPKVPDILEAFKLHKSFLKVGEHFGVSDNAVRKWCKSYGIMEMVKV